VEGSNIKLRLIAAVWQPPATYLGRCGKRPYLVGPATDPTTALRRAPVHPLSAEKCLPKTCALLNLWLLALPFPPWGFLGARLR